MVNGRTCPGRSCRPRQQAVLAQGAEDVFPDSSPMMKLHDERRSGEDTAGNPRIP
jgi:hypothetical protein